MRRALLALTLAAAAPFAAVSGCSLGLDESKIGGLPEAAPFDDGGAPDGPRPNPTNEAGTDAGGLPTACTRNEDCATTAGCLTGRCDLARKACAFDVCLSSTCNGGTCDPNARTCSPPKPRTLRAGTFPVGAGVGCGGGLGNPDRCLAFVYPFVFVGTTNGVVAFSAEDPASASPRQVPVKGVGFLPTSLVAAGSRVFMLGASAAVGANSRVQIAVLDVPTDPFTKELSAVTILSSFDRPSGDVILPRENDTAYLLQLAAPASFPTGILQAPLREPLDVKSAPLVFTAGANPMAVSGNRVVMQLSNAQNQSTMAFVTGAGTPQAAKAGELLLAAAGNVTTQQSFSTLTSGAVYWAVAQLNGPPPINTLRAARGHFLVADANAPFDPAGGVDLQVYPNIPAASAIIGPAALVDADTAIVSFAVPPALNTTDVRVHKRAGGLLPPKVTLTQPIAQLGAAGSSGLAVILAAESPTASSIHVFDPACN